MTVLIQFYFYRLSRAFCRIIDLIPFTTFQSSDYLQILDKTTSGLWELVQCYAALVITGAIRRSFREKRYHELELRHLHHRRWLRRFCSQSPLK